MRKVRVSVKQRPPQRSLASRTTNLRPAAATRRAAAMPAAPAPTIKTSKSGRAAGAASTGAAATATEPARNARRFTGRLSITDFYGLGLATPDADPSDTSFDESSGS